MAGNTNRIQVPLIYIKALNLDFSANLATSLASQINDKTCISKDRRSFLFLSAQEKVSRSKCNEKSDWDCNSTPRGSEGGGGAFAGLWGKSGRSE